MPSTNTNSTTARNSFGAALLLALVASVAVALLRYFPLVWNLAPVGALALFTGARLRSWQWVLLPLGLILIVVLTPWVLLTWGYRVVHARWIGGRDLIQNESLPLLWRLGGY